MLETLSLKQSLTALDYILSFFQSLCHWKKIKGSKSSYVSASNT